MPVGYQQDHTQLTLVGSQTGHNSLSIVLEKRLRYNLLNTSWLLPVVLGGSIDRRQAKEDLKIHVHQLLFATKRRGVYKNQSIGQCLTYFTADKSYIVHC